MDGNSLGVVLSREGLAAAERSEGSPGEPQRSEAAAKAGADSVAALRPETEVVAKPKRRRRREAALALFSVAKVCTRLC